MVVFRFRSLVKIHLFGVDFQILVHRVKLPGSVVVSCLERQCSAALAVNFDVRLTGKWVRIKNSSACCVLLQLSTLRAVLERQARKTDGENTDAVLTRGTQAVINKF